MDDDDRIQGELTLSGVSFCVACAGMWRIHQLPVDRRNDETAGVEIDHSTRRGRVQRITKFATELGRCRQNVGSWSWP
jgi:hypothetical protein